MKRPRQLQTGLSDDIRPVSTKFATLLQEALHADQECTQLRDARQERQERYKELLRTTIRKKGETERLHKSVPGSDSESNDSTISAELRSREENRRSRLRRTQELYGDALKRRTKAFSKLYKIAQREIDFRQERTDDNRQYLPGEFFDKLQELLDICQGRTAHGAELSNVRKELIKLGKRLKRINRKNPKEEEDLVRQHQEASKMYAEAKADAKVHAENQFEEEGSLLFLTQGYIASEPTIEDNVVRVARGNDHVSLSDKDAIEEVDAIPNNRENLVEALQSAQVQLEATNARYSQLACDYEDDLARHQAESPTVSRTVFDRQFCSDRARAMRDVGVVERRQDRLKARLKAGGFMHLSEMSSDFCDFDGDFKTESGGPGAQEWRRVREESNRPYILKFIAELGDHPANPYEAAPQPSREYDSDWEASDWEFGDTDGLSAAAFDLEDRRQIRK